MQYFARPLGPDSMQGQVCSISDEERDSAPANDWNISVIIMSGVAATLAAVLVLFFCPKYKRTAAERGRGLHLPSGGKSGGNGLLDVAVEEIDRPADAEEMDLREAKPVGMEEATPGTATTPADDRKIGDEV